MKRVVATALTLALSASLFAGCGQKTEEPAKTDTTKVESGEQKTDEAKELKGEIRYAYWGNGQEAFINNTVEAFEKKHPQVKVVIEALPWSEYWTKLEASAMGGSMPDVLFQHPQYIEQYVESDLLLDLSNVDGVDFNNFPSGINDLFKYNDKMYGVPKDFDTIGLFYNKEIFDNAGIEYPNADWDWEKLVEVAKQLTDQEKDVYGFGAAITAQQGYYNTLVQAGGGTLNAEGKSGFDTPESVEGMGFWYDMIYKHKASPTPEQFADTKPEQMFTAGKLAMVMRGSWVMDSFKRNEIIKDKFDVAPLPAGPTGKATMTNSLCFSIAANTENKELALEFVKFLGNKEAQEIEASFGGAIPAYIGAADKWVEYYGDYNSKVFIDSLEFGYPLPRTKNTSKWYSVVKDYARLMISGQVTIEEGCKELAIKMNEIIADEE